MEIVTITKEKLIKLLQEDSSPMSTPIGIYLNCINDDKGVISSSVNSLEYSKLFNCLLMEGTYEEDEY